MKAVAIRDDFIKLGQLLKLAGLVSTGVEAKAVITGGEVKLNAETEVRRGKKVFPQDVIEYGGEEVMVIKE